MSLDEHPCIRSAKKSAHRACTYFLVTPLVLYAHNSVPSHPVDDVLFPVVAAATAFVGVTYLTRAAVCLYKARN
ncbi:MAG: hypothetical protein ACMXYD_02800 [Candidatus Woesearchaeota archaeon]